MTIGQRIAHKRKELALSQEALGEQLGVSRQAIYKWESDAALPEIDKLIALAKLFGVSVGWLLGVEEAPEAAQPEENELPPPTDELSETQLRMVQEIVEQYLAAQPKPRSRRRWPWVLLGFAVLVGGFSIIDRLDQINQQYHRVQMTVSNVQDSVNTQINGISDRVEAILKAQNDLTAEYGTEVKSANLTQNQITFSVYAVPKTFVEGMQASFSADDSPDLNVNVETVTAHSNQKFSTDITCDLTNSISLSVTFIYPDGTKQTQLLDTYEHLYSSSMPDARVQTHTLMFAEAPDGHVPLSDLHATVTLSLPEKQLDGPYMSRDKVRDVQVGLFENKHLLCLAEPVAEPPYGGYEYGTDYLFKFPDMPLTFGENTTVYIAALITDQYGRQTVAHDIPYIWDPENGNITHPSYSVADTDPANWDFD